MMLGPCLEQIETAPSIVYSRILNQATPLLLHATVEGANSIVIRIRSHIIIAYQLAHPASIKMLNDVGKINGRLDTI